MEKILKKCGRIYYFAFFIIILYVLVDLLKASIMGAIFEYINQKYTILSLVFLIVSFVVIMLSVGIAKVNVLEKSRVKFKQILTIELTSSYMRLTPEQFHKNYSTSDIINNLNSKIDAIVQCYFMNKLNIFYFAISIVLGSIYIGRINFLMIVIILVFSILTLLFNKIFQKKMELNQIKVLEKNQKWISVNKEIFENFDLIRNYKIENLMEKEIEIANKELNSMTYKANTFSKQISLLNDGITIVLFLFITLLGVFFISYGYISIGQLLSITQACNLILNPLSYLANLKNEKYSVNTFIAEVIESINIKTEEINNTQSDFSIIDIKELSYSYNDNIIFDNLNMKLEKGKKYIICGKSGCGKSTFLKILAKNITNYKGNVMVDDQELKNIKFNEWMNTISYMKQDSSILPLTLEKNIILNKTKDEAKLLRIMKSLNLHEFIHKLNNEFLEDNAQISGGEKQRINLARALYQEHKLLLLDESFSALDRTNEYEILKMVLSLDCTIFAISHRLDESILKLFDNVIYFDSNSKIYIDNYYNLKDTNKNFSDFVSSIKQ